MEYPKKTACVDLDGVLAEYHGWKGLDHIGDVRPGAVEFMTELCKVATVVVFTTRCKADDPALGRDGEHSVQLAERIHSWLKANNVPYHEVYRGQGKPIAACYIDDRAVELPANPVASDFEKIWGRITTLLAH